MTSYDDYKLATDRDGIADERDDAPTAADLPCVGRCGAPTHSCACPDPMPVAPRALLCGCVEDGALCAEHAPRARRRSTVAA